jgi:2,4-dienoyl-CoA reductase-like NADH-dependent reductase (Old Yellow Enzyme family)
MPDPENLQHGCLAETDHDREVPQIDLMSPLTIRGITFRNRIGVSPMCQYIAKDGFVNDWHLVHLGSRAVGGASLVMSEATAVTEEGRISPGDLGIWSDAHIEPLARITSFIHSQGAVAGMQLAHAGRKGSCVPPWQGGFPLPKEKGWDLIAPSALAFAPGNPVPQSLTESDLKKVLLAFESAAKRVLKAGFKVIEIHAAHGYLLHEFLSPLSNKREDSYGGSLENRIRFPLEVAKQVRACLPDELPLFVRISASDWVEDGWDLEQSLFFATKLKEVGVDLIDVSSGGLVPKATIPVGKNYQVPFARSIREQSCIKTAAVGLITEVGQANEIITNGDADLIFMGREFLREPYWALKAQHELGSEQSWPTSYGYAVKRRAR